MEAYPQVLDALKAWFDARGDENARTEVDGVPMLRAMVPLLGGGRGLVLMEIFVIPYGEGTELLQFYTTVTKEDGPGMDDLRRAANAWNLSALAGGYGIYEPAGQLFHRHTVALATDLPQQAREETALEARYVTVDEITRRLPEAIGILNPPASGTPQETP